jgi:hypothetical protein
MANLTDQQEKFCHEIVKGKSQFEAYQVAYPTSVKWKRGQIDHKASVLSGQEKIQGRIDTLRQPLIRKTTYDALAAHEEAGMILDRAMEVNQLGPAVAAVQLRAKLHGLITEKREVKVTKMDDFSATEQLDMISALSAELARRKALSAPSDVQDVDPK